MRHSPALGEITQQVHRELIRTVDSGSAPDAASIRGHVERVAPLLSQAAIDQVVGGVAQRLFGLGPLETVLADPSVTEIMINGPGTVWIERFGALERTELAVDEALLRVIIERIVGPLGLRVDRTSPFVDARLDDGSRVNVAVPPLAIDGPYLTIRRFRAEPLTLLDFCSPAVADLLAAAMRDRLNLIVSGGTGSGKTSLLNALASHIPGNERVVTIEDAAELRLPGDHTVRLEARPPNAEGVGEVSVRSLVRNALRMRPDRIIVGEVRGIEALDMIQAMNTGHDGSVSTCHANSPRDALRRLESMAMMGGDAGLPLSVVRDQLLSALDLVVHVARADHGQRRVMAVYRCRDETFLARGDDVIEPIGQLR